MKKSMITVSVMVALILLVLAGGYSQLRGGANAPAIGTPAPDFTLSAEDGQPLKLSTLRGQWVVLYFYPKDFTSGCTVEAHNFQRDLAEYQKRNAVILGVSVQDAASHKEFCAKEVLKTYDSVINLGIAKLSSRHTFLIDSQGVLRKVWLDVNVQKHSQEVLSAIDDFQKSKTATP